MGRTEKILHRVKRDLNVSSGEAIADPEILDSMQRAQKKILSLERILKKEVDLVTVAAEDRYSLIVSSRTITGRILTLKRPLTWGIPIKILPVEKFTEEQQKTYSSGQPLYAAVLGNELLLHPPTPNDGETLRVIFFLKNSTADINFGVEPELDSEWDEAIQYWALFDLSKGKDKGDYLALFNAELEANGITPHDQQSESLAPEANW